MSETDLSPFSGGHESRRKSSLKSLMRYPDRLHRLNIELSPFTGLYKWGSEVSSAERLMIEKHGTPAVAGNFASLREAYIQFDKEGKLDNDKRFEMLMEFVWLFHQNFSFTDRFSTDRFIDEYPFFVECVLEIINKYNIPHLVRADLCRHAGMFRKCFEYVKHVPDGDERELMDEVCLRAAKGDRYPIDYETVCRYLSPSMSETSPFVYWFYNGFLY